MRFGSVSAPTLRGEKREDMSVKRRERGRDRGGGGKGKEVEEVGADSGKRLADGKRQRGNFQVTGDGHQWTA
jgi:hypothetical protein